MSIKSDTPPLPEERRSTEWAYGELRRRILSGEIGPGVELSQARLATELGISRTPLREATRQLQNEGLLIGERNRRLRVAEVSLADLDEIYAIRITTEAFALRVAVPRMTDECLSSLGSALASLEAAALDSDTERVEVAHRQFHSGLVAPAGERIALLSRTLWDHTVRYRAAFLSTATNPIGTMFEANADHHVILDAAARGNADLAGALLAAHYGRTARSVIRAVDPGHSPDLVVEALRSVGAADLP